MSEVRAKPLEESGGTERRGGAEIREWLIGSLAELLGVAPAEIDATRPLESYGLGSTEVVVFAGDLEDWLGREVSPRIVFDYPTVDALADRLGRPG